MGSIVGAKKSSKDSQQIIDKFWGSVLSATPAPTKASSVLPPNIHSQEVKTNVPRGATVSESVDVSYQNAKAICQKKVAQIVRECTMMNQKYSDPYFDLESRGICLYPLRANPRPDPSDASGDDAPGVSFDITQNQNISGKLFIYDQNLPAAPSIPPMIVPPSVKRVGDIFDKPQFFVDGARATDIRQGVDGDCWFLSALMTLCTVQSTSDMIERLCVAQDQDVGVYGFVLFRDGEWISVIIDDKLYLRKSDYEDTDEQVRSTWEDNRIRVNSAEEYRKEFQSNSRALYYAQSTDPNETWVPLIEKAFAKAHGDYGSIESGAVGEGVEDLTGGISTTILSANILSKDKFWQDLLKVNKDFLFGCGTTDWDDPYGNGRDGIHGGHAYSILDAKEFHGQRLLQMKNPWGQSEWNGPWSDGSKEWTPEAMTALDHRFGDDGVFWIRFEDMLRKYVVIWRTRLFSKEWRVAQQWTCLAVPWAGEYQDAKFEVMMKETAPAVIILSNLDDRFFRGLTGQYQFKLSFRLHKAGEEDYITRTFTSEYGDRSASVELPTLDQGTYEVRLRISGWRNDNADKIEDVVKDNWLDRREKLLQIGLSYDLAHAKAQVKEIQEKKKARPLSITKTKTTTKQTTTKTTTTETTKTETQDGEPVEEIITKEKKDEPHPAKDENKHEKKDEPHPAKDDNKHEKKDNSAKDEGKREKIEVSDAPTSGSSTGAAPGQTFDGLIGHVHNGPPEEPGTEPSADEVKPDEDDGNDDDGASNVAQPENNDDDDDSEEADAPWGAVCVVGLRVYTKDTDASIRIIRPEAEAAPRLDVDNPARDAAGPITGDTVGAPSEADVKDIEKKFEEIKLAAKEGDKIESKEENADATDNGQKSESGRSDDAVVVEASDAAH